MVFDGTSWHIIAGAADLGTVVQKTSVLNDAGKRDVSVAIGAYSPKSNDVITIGKDTATPNASWVGLTGALTVGQQFMWNGSAWVAPDGSKLPSYGIEEKRYVSMLDLSASTLGDGTNPSIPKITIAGQEYRGDRINDAGSSDAGNIGIGLNALQYAHRPSGGASNVAVGENAGAALKAGSENILLGSWAGYKLVDGTANICIGSW
jgi:hypothetical protein